ncbi:hypothetical protein C5473_05585 [Leptospira interrogans serovar Weerasinghe]|nr:hypothetical protein C5473_05585 [Leptospira interrogans serovar Weerasinghe]
MILLRFLCTTNFGTRSKFLDLHSTYLMEKCARGEVIPEITVAYYQKTKNGSLYLQSSRNLDGQCSGCQCHLRCGRESSCGDDNLCF